jgi:hypothetical protein
MSAMSSLGLLPLAALAEPPLATMYITLPAD